MLSNYVPNGVNTFKAFRY